MDKILILVSCFSLCLAKIKITRLDVPSAILYGSQNDVILDCDFDPDSEEVTEIKWFLNGDNQIYQWLPTTHTPARAIGKLKDNIDTSYKATNDEKTMYRALHIRDLSPELTGNYTCKVSGFDSEDTKTKAMTIYVIPENTDGNDEQISDENNDDDDDNDSDILELTVSEETSTITCSAEGLYPKPNMTLYITNENDTDIVFLEDDEIFSINEEGYYNVTLILEYDGFNLTQNFDYTCELNLPGTPFNVSQTRRHAQENATAKRCSSLLLIVLLGILRTIWM